MARLRHLAILTENVERLVRFYTTAFGMKIVERAEDRGSGLAVQHDGS